MNDNLFAPPAIVKHQEASAELKALAKTLRGRMAGRDRMNLDDAVQLGEVLVKLRTGCAHGAWIPLLAELGIHRRQAHRYIEVFKCDSSHISNCNSIAEALEAAKVREDVEEQEVPPEREPGDESESEPGSPWNAPADVSEVLAPEPIKPRSDNATASGQKAVRQVPQANVNGRVASGDGGKPQPVATPPDAVNTEAPAVTKKALTAFGAVVRGLSDLGLYDGVRREVECVNYLLHTAAANPGNAAPADTPAVDTQGNVLTPAVVAAFANLAKFKETTPPGSSAHRDGRENDQQERTPQRPQA
jgi:hypothetical protein